MDKMKFSHWIRSVSERFPLFSILYLIMRVHLIIYTTGQKFGHTLHIIVVFSFILMTIGIAVSQ